MPDTFPLDATPQFIGAEDEFRRRVSNGGPGTIYFSSQRTVSSTSNDGSLAPGASQEFQTPHWFMSPTAALVLVNDPDTSLALQTALDDLQTAIDALGGVRAPFTNVRDLDPDPDSVTDWGPIINTALADGIRHLVFQDVSTDGLGTEYPFSTQISLTGTVGVLFEGAGGMNDHYGLVASNLRMPSYLRWTGTGTTAPIHGQSSSGFVCRGMGIYYDSSSFTGKLLDLTDSCVVATIEFCHLGSLDDEFTSAECLIAVSASWQIWIQNCSLRGAQWGVLGVRDGQTFCDTIRIKDNNFSHFDVAHLGFIGRQWQIEDNFFGMGLTGAGVDITTPAVIDDGAAGVTHDSIFTFRGNSVWDARDLQDTPWFHQRSTNPWYCTFEDNEILIKLGPIFDLNASFNNVQIIRNPRLLANSGPIVDANDVTMDMLTFVGNGCASSEETVINTAGVRNLNVYENDPQPYALDRRTYMGHERIGYTAGASVPRPEIAVETALGTGATASISGTDMAGIITLNKGTGNAAGKQATVTLGTTLETDPGGLGTLLVQVWVLDRGSNDWDVGVVPGVFTGGTSAWEINFKHAMTLDTVYLGYRVLGV